MMRSSALAPAARAAASGKPPTGRHQSISERDIAAVARVLRSDWITQGPKVAEFEERLAAACGASYGVAFSSGTAGLHAACSAAGIGPGDEVITTPLTFVGTANAVVYQGGTPIFADIDPHTLTIDAEHIARRISPRTKALIPVHFAGLPCDMGRIAELATRRGLLVIEDACHALGAEWRSPEGRWERIGGCSRSDMAVFSFHPVKHITTGEGGMVLTNREDLARRLRAFRHHGMTRLDESTATSGEPWDYEMRSLGYNYRLTDFQCALGLEQLSRLGPFLERRREIAQAYRAACRDLGLTMQEWDHGTRRHAWHLVVVQLPLERLGRDRQTIYRALRNAGLRVNVHYLPVHLHPFYRERFPSSGPGSYPVAERYYERALTLPVFPEMTARDFEMGIGALRDVIEQSTG